MDLLPFIDRFNRRYAEVESEMGNPEIASQPHRYQALTKEYSRLKSLVDHGARYLRTQRQIQENRELIKSESSDSELFQLAREELQQLEADEKRLTLQVQLGIVPADPTDSRNTIFEIRAGAGGSESALFVADLYRMYTRYAERQGWTLEMMDSSASDMGGFKEVIYKISGLDVYKRLKYESGVHRVQRVPMTEAQGRIHTSTATVAVLPEAKEVDVEIRPDELEISVCRASGPGGQGVNTTDSAVQILHKPSGLIVRCMDGRSQQKNKDKAMTVLRSRLLEAKMAEEHQKYAAERKSQVGTGERNERIRTYNFPQNRLTDHRIELTLYNLPTVLDGDLDSVIEPLMADDLRNRLNAIHKG